MKASAEPYAITTLTYDEDGNIASITDPNGNAPGADPARYRTDYEYGANGRTFTSRPR